MLPGIPTRSLLGNAGAMSSLSIGSMRLKWLVQCYLRPSSPCANRVSAARARLTTNCGSDAARQHHWGQESTDFGAKRRSICKMWLLCNEPMQVGEVTLAIAR